MVSSEPYSKFVSHQDITHAVPVSESITALMERGYF